VSTQGTAGPGPSGRGTGNGVDADDRATGGVEVPEVVHVPAPSWFRSGVIRVTLVAIGVLVGAWLIMRLSGFLTTLLLSVFLAFALEPAVNWLSRRGMRRGAATGLTMLVFFVGVAFFAYVIGALVVEQVQAISDDFPGYVDTSTKYLQDHFEIDLTEQSEKIKDFGLSNLPGLAGSAVGIFTTLVGLIFQLFTVVLFTFYICARGPQLRRSVCSMLPPKHQTEVIRAWTLAIDKTAGFLLSRVVLGAASALAHGIAFWVLDVPYALTLALWVGLVSQFIPTVGTYLAGALPVLVALSVSPKAALFVLIFVIVYQQIENYLFTPPLSARTMEINPAVAFGAVIVGATLFGVTGAFLALPMTATGTAFIGAYIKRHDLVEDEALELGLPDADAMLTDTESTDVAEDSGPAQP
jgi:predicted PurR-regulated permease PerM